MFTAEELEMIEDLDRDTVMLLIQVKTGRVDVPDLSGCEIVYSGSRFSSFFTYGPCHRLVGEVVADRVRNCDTRVSVTIENPGFIRGWLDKYRRVNS